jgi:hypothetical protein
MDNDQQLLEVHLIV